MEDKSKTTGIGHFLAQFDKDNSAWLVANGFPDDLDRAVKIAVAELGEFVTSQDIADFPGDNIWDLLQTCVDRREWLEARDLKRLEGKPQWSMYRTPKEWRGLRKAKGLAASEGTWLALRKKHPDDIHGEPGNDSKSCQITRSLAESWELSLPEFTP